MESDVKLALANLERKIDQKSYQQVKMMVKHLSDKVKSQEERLKALENQPSKPTEAKVVQYTDADARKVIESMVTEKFITSLYKGSK